MAGRLLIGTKRYSSWSLRGWLAVHLAGLDVEEVRIPLAGAEAGGTPEVRSSTPAGLVPYLEHDGARVWESLAILEYCAEAAPPGTFWPEDRVARAALRSAATEMHGGFGALRRAFPMVLGGRASEAARDARLTAEARADLARVCALWGEALATAGGPYLGGAAFGGADVMFAPVCTRVATWGLDVPGHARAYRDAVHAHPLVARWHAEAEAEPAAWRLERYEAALRG